MTLHAPELHNHLDGDYLLWHIEHDHPGQLTGLLRQYGLERVSTDGLMAWARTRLLLMDVKPVSDGPAVLFQALHEQAHRDDLKTQTLEEGLALGRADCDCHDKSHPRETDPEPLFSVGD